MPSNDSGTVSIPATGLTFTPVVQPEPTLPKPRQLREFYPGSKVVTSGTPNPLEGSAVYTVVNTYQGKRPLGYTHTVYEFSLFFERDSFYSVDDFVPGTKQLKPIPAVSAPLVSYDELKCGEVAIVCWGSCQSDVHIYKGHFNDECMWWYGTVDMAMRVLDRRGDSDGGFGFSGGAKVLRVVGTLRNNLSH